MTRDETERAVELARLANSGEWRGGGPAYFEGVQKIAAALLSAHAELERMRTHVAHNDEEYKTMKDVLRAEHEECQRLRAELDRMRPVWEAAKEYHEWYGADDTESVWQAAERLWVAIDAARAEPAEEELDRG